MPYVDPASRKRLRPVLEAFQDALDEGPGVTAGDLNYLLSCMCLAYVRKKGETYSLHNEVVGVLECAKLEHYRRRLAPYEDEKCKTHGDIG